MCCGVLWAATLGSTAALSRGADYYFSAAGSDAAGDGSLASPWKTVAKFNQLDLNPGDSAYFRAGDDFAGRLLLDAADSGANGAGQFVAPVRISAYGSANAADRARILAPANSEGFLAYNNGGVELSGLEFVAGAAANGVRKNGVRFYTDKTPTGGLNRFDHIRVSNVAVHGFADSGLAVYAEDRVGYSDVQIVGSEFYGNAFAGINVGAARWQDLIHSGVTIDNVVAHDNPGSAGSGPHSGHGVVIAQVDGGVIQGSVARDNGKAFGYGNVGIWAWQSNNVVIQNNLAYGNRSPAGGDGGAFDLDGGVTNSVVQYNRSYDNDGAGLLLAQFASADPMSHNVFRYNLSVNDGRDNYGGITIWGASANDVATSAVFHNNTIVVDKSVVANAGGAIWFLEGYHDDVALINNALVALNGAKLITGQAVAGDATFTGNSYWTDSGPIVLEDATYASVQAWSAAKNQERIGGQFVGVTSDPDFIDGLEYRPHAFSPLVEAALQPGSVSWPDWIASLGPQDLEGLSIFLGGGPEIGAHEIRLGDVNYDGRVDSDDLLVLQAAIEGDVGTQARHDLDGDGDVDGAEILIWQRQEESAAGAAAQSLAAPEPDGAIIISSAGAIGILARRNGQAARLGRPREGGKLPVEVDAGD